MQDDRQTATTIVSLLLAASVVAFLLSLLPGCNAFSLLPHPARPVGTHLMIGVPVASARCDALNTDVIALTATSVGFGVLSSGSGVTSLFTSSTSRYITGGVGIGLALFSGVFTSLSASFAANFTQECTTPTVSL